LKLNVNQLFIRNRIRTYSYNLPFPIHKSIISFNILVLLIFVLFIWHLKLSTYFSFSGVKEPTNIIQDSHKFNLLEIKKHYTLAQSHIHFFMSSGSLNFYDNGYSNVYNDDLSSNDFCNVAIQKH